MLGLPGCSVDAGAHNPQYSLISPKHFSGNCRRLLFNTRMVTAFGFAQPRATGPTEVNAMSFFTLPPEINSLRMFLGAGSTPMLQASAAWSGLAEELGAAANSFSSVTSNLASQAW